MEKDKKRLDFISKQISDFVRINAVDGSVDPRDDKNTTFFCKNFCTDAMIGIMRSHVKCWQYVVDNNLEYAIILEDDANLCIDFRKEVEKRIKSTKPTEWDIMLLGCFLCNSKNNDFFARTIMTSLNPFAYQKEYNELLYIPASWQGTHAYAVNRKSAQKLLSIFKKASYHIDYDMAHNDQLKVLSSIKQLATQNTTTEGSYNAVKTENSIFSGCKIDYGMVDVDFILTMPAGQVGGVKINSVLIVTWIFYLIILYFIYYFISHYTHNKS